MISIKISNELVESAKEYCLENGYTVEGPDGEQFVDTKRKRQTLIGFGGDVHVHKSGNYYYYLIPTYGTGASELEDDGVATNGEIISKYQIPTSILRRLERSVAEKEYYHDQPEVDKSKIVDLEEIELDD